MNCREFSDSELKRTHRSSGRLLNTGLFLLVSLIILGLNVAGQGACISDPTTLCLQSDRFEVTLNWENFEGNEYSLQPPDASGAGQATSISDESGYFWFPNSRGQENIEVFIKVLNGCPVNGNFWVFSAGTTNLEVSLTVRDLETQQTRVYTNPAGRLFHPIIDTNAFSTCEVNAPPSSSSPMSQWPSDFLFDGAPEGSLVLPIEPSGSDGGAAQVGSCTPGPTNLCLTPDRFKVEVEWTVFDATTGQGYAIPTANSNESGSFWFFTPSNVEIIVKILDGRLVNGHFWLFIGAMTNVEFTVRVTDTYRGQVHSYTNPLGNMPAPVGDNDAFSVLPPPLKSYSLPPNSGPAFPGDIISYEVRVFGDSQDSFAGVSFVDILDPNTTLQAGSVTTSKGVVVEGNGGGDQKVVVDIGGLGSTDTVTIGFSASVKQPFPKGVSSVVNQGSLSGAGFANLRTSSVTTPVEVHIALIPTLSTWGLILFGLLLSGFAVYLIRPV